MPSFRIKFTPEGIARAYLMKHFPEASEEAQLDLIECMKLIYNEGVTAATESE